MLKAYGREAERRPLLELGELEQGGSDGGWRRAEESMLSRMFPLEGKGSVPQEAAWG